MHTDLHDLTDDVAEAVEICVIGSGAAGITTARRLLELGHSVLLLESGGLDYEPEIAALNAGENLGEDYYDLEDARLRFFGGTHTRSGAAGSPSLTQSICNDERGCLTLDGRSLRRRLDRYYRPARQLFGLSASTVPLDTSAAAKIPVPLFDKSRLKLSLWEFDRRFNRFVFDALRRPRSP